MLLSWTDLPALILNIKAAICRKEEESNSYSKPEMADV